jgi:hypothetical protein
VKVFISWSGVLSRQLAEAFHQWLPGALQSVSPYFTPSDIEKGDRWNNEISKELEGSDVGILFLTRENVGSPWLLYEAGALSKRLEKPKVCPITVGIGHADLSGPLRQFQATEFNEEDFRKLLKTINKASGEAALKDGVVDDVFDMWWPRLEERFNNILSDAEASDDNAPLRSEREILEEVLELSRLTAHRSARMGGVHPEAIRDLVGAIIEAHDAIQGEIDPQAALSALSKARKPIKYIAGRTRATPEKDNENPVAALSRLDFDYKAPDDDDDIPF